MSRTRKALIAYVNAATNLAESIVRNIRKDGIIDDKTVTILNEFAIASNNVSDLTDELKNANIKRNGNSTH